MLRSNDGQFSQLAESIIDKIATSLEEQDPEGVLDIDFSSDMLNIITPKGQYVINKHRAAREIWLASPKTGPYHFAYNANQSKWLDSQNNELISLVEQELRDFININLSHIK